MWAHRNKLEWFADSELVDIALRIIDPEWVSAAYGLSKHISCVVSRVKRQC